MRAVLQRVLSADVVVNDECVGSIEKGFVVFLGIGKNDSSQDLDYLVKKICGLRIFEDEFGKMNLSPSSVNAEMLVISNFTLYANTSHGFRPDFLESMPHKGAKEFVEMFVMKCKQQNCFKKIETGVFGADMRVTCVNDGPVTIIFDKENMI